MVKLEKDLEEAVDDKEDAEEYMDFVKADLEAAKTEAKNLKG